MKPIHWRNGKDPEQPESSLNGTGGSPPSLAVIVPMGIEGKDMKCDAKNKAGRSCGAPSVGGARFCIMHSGRASELGSKGGRRRARLGESDLKELPAPRTAADLRDLLAQAIVEVRVGKLDPKLANSINYLGSGFLHAIEVADIEQRLKELERTEQRSKNSSEEDEHETR